MNLLQSLFRRNASTTQRYDGVDFSGVDPLDFAWSFGGNSYMGIPGATGYKTETLESSFLGLVQGAYKRNSVVFACMRARLSVFSEGRFQFQRMNNGTPGDLFGDSSDGRTAGSSGLRLLETPWPNGTTGDLLTRMLQDADLAGNSYWTVRNGNLRRMRPDWVSIVMGSREDSRVGPDDLDAELLGYFYTPGGPFNKTSDPVFLLPDEVAHFAPTPDPIAHYRGMSWLTPIIREVEADTAATVHKLAFFQNGATLQTIISFKDMKQEVFEAFVKKMDLAHKGAQNAYKTLYLGGGADATVVGADLRQLDFKATQGAGETRIAAAAGVPPAIVGLSEGLQGSSLNAGNLGQLRRQFAEGTLSTLWRNVAASLATLVAPPTGSQLVVDTRFIPFLREDHQDRASILQMQASTLASLLNAGYTPESAVAALEAEDLTLLKHTGLFSVQLQPPSAGALPGSIEAGTSSAAAATLSVGAPVVSGVPKARAAIAAAAFDEDDIPWDDDTLALYWAISELCGDGSFTRATWNPDLHPRDPRGRFLSTFDRVKKALEDHKGGRGKGDPFAGFNREQLRKVAKQRGIELQRGEDRDSIAQKLLDHLNPKKAAKKAVRPVVTAPHEHVHEHELPKLGETRRLDWSDRIHEVSPEDREEISRELDVQAALTPRASIVFNGVRGADDMPADVNAYYYADSRSVRVNWHTVLDLHGSRHTTEHEAGMASRGGRPFITKAGDDRSDLQSTMAHEYGHHVDFTLRLAERDELFATLAGELGVKPPPPGLGDVAYTDWLNRNKGKIYDSVSVYAAHNPRELMAEIWREYSTNPNARPLIRTVGDAMRRLAEGQK